MADIVGIDKTVIGWLISIGGAFIMFLLSLGVKDVRDRLAKIPEIGKELEAVRSAHDRIVAEQNGEIRSLGIQIADLKEEIRRLRDALNN